MPAFCQFSDWTKLLPASGLLKTFAGAVFSTSKNTYGHVGIVIDVQGDTIIVQEGNYGPQQWNYPSFIKHGIGECYTNAGWRTSIYNVNSLNAVYANPK